MSDRLTIATLNVCGLSPAPVLGPLVSRAPRLGRVLDDMDIDVLNLQEVFYRAQYRALRGALSSFPYACFRRGTVGPSGGLVTFSRVRLGRPSYRSFAGIRPPAGTVRFRAKRSFLSAVQGSLSIDLVDHPVTIVNTHLTANTDDDYTASGRFHGFQRAQLQRLDRVLAAPRGTALTVVSGDFNLASVGDLYPMVVDHGARLDPFAGTDPYTYHPAFLRAGETPYRVDYILLMPADVRPAGAATFLDSAIEGRYLSDHVGLTVRIDPTGILAPTSK